MRKIFIYFLALFFFGCLVFFGLQHSSFAEEESTPEATYSAPWLEYTFEPYFTPVPSPSPEAGGGSGRTSQDTLNATHIYSLATSCYWQGGLNSRSVQYRFLQGTSQGGSVWPIQNRAGHTTYLNLNDDDEPETFSSIQVLSTGAGSWYNSYPVSVRNGCFVMSINDYPDIALTKGYSIRYSISSSGLTPSFGASSAVPPAFSVLGIDDSYLLSNLYVSIQIAVYYTDGTSFQYSEPLHSWLEFVGGLDFTVTMANNDPQASVDHLGILVIIQPSFQLSELYESLVLYYESNQTPSADRLYGQWYLAGTGNMMMSRIVDMSEGEYNRVWWQSWLFTQLVPDPDHIQQIIDDAGFVDQSGLSVFVLGLRQLILDSSTTSAGRDFFLTFPAFHPNIGGVQYNFWDKYDFNISQAVRLKPIRGIYSVREVLTLGLNLLLVSAFVNSLVAFFVGFYDLHLWQGVHGGGEED